MIINPNRTSQLFKMGQTDINVAFSRNVISPKKTDGSKTVGSSQKLSTYLSIKAQKDFSKKLHND